MFRKNLSIFFLFMLVVLCFPVMATEDEESSDAEVTVYGQQSARKVPSWYLTDTDGLEWADSNFTGNPTIYVLADISLEDGLEELLAWNFLVRQLSTLPIVNWAPNCAVIASTTDDPDSWEIKDILDLLMERQDPEHLYGVLLADVEGEVAEAFDLSDVERPNVIVADASGKINCIITGKISEISDEGIQDVITVIGEMWRWSTSEWSTLPKVVTMIVKLLAIDAYDETVREEEPLPTAYETAPKWGVPDRTSDR